MDLRSKPLNLVFLYKTIMRNDEVRCVISSPMIDTCQVIHISNAMLSVHQTKSQ